MDRAALLEKLNQILAQWERSRTSGTIEIEVSAGVITWLCREEKENFTAAGGPNGPRRETRIL